MNPYLKKLMPKWLYKWLRRQRAYLHLIRESRYNIKRQLSYSSTFADDRKALLVGLMRMTHVLEKGITMPERRLGFGQERVRVILRQLDNAISAGGEWNSTEVQSTLADLKQYMDIHKETSYKLPQDIENGIESLLPNLIVNDDNCYKTTKEDFFPKIPDFLTFAESRHSVRWFSDKPVDESKLMAAISLAQTAPSACNRQATRIKIISSERNKKLCCSLQNGNHGFGDKADKWLLITTEMRAWSHTDRDLGIVDAGIFLMNLLYALHYYGIVACTLNAQLDIKSREKLQQALGYPKSEMPVAFVVVGNPAEEFMVPKSRRLPAEDIVEWA